jgi:DNA-binding transcriptional regulator YiaG
MTKDQRRFRQLLLEGELSQAQLAALLGVDTGTVNRWHQGRTRVPAYAIAYLELLIAANKLVGAAGRVVQA